MHLDDPRLTAYALGELDPAEREHLEALLATSPEARQELEDIRAAANHWTEALASEPAPAIEATFPDRLAQVPRDPAPSSIPGTDTPILIPVPIARWRDSSWVIGTLAAAAALVAVAGIWAAWNLRNLSPSAPNLTLAKHSAPDPEPIALPPDSQAPPSPAFAVDPTPQPSDPPTPPPQSRGVTLVSPSPTPTAAPPRSAASPLSPELMRRYGLFPGTTPRPAIEPSASPPPATPSSPHPTPDTLFHIAPGNRYGLAPQTAEPRAESRTLTLGRSLSASPASPVPATQPLPALTQLGREPSFGADLTPSREQESVSRDWPFRPEPSRAVPSDNPGYLDVGTNPFLPARNEPLSTFALDVDTGSYANVRRFLNAGRLPPPGAVRAEELINYFQYRLPEPRGDDTFGIEVEVASCPWAPRHRLVRIALHARPLSGPRPPANLVFLVDVSGSMAPPERLPLLKQGLHALARRLAPTDRIAIVTYASTAGVRLESTPGEHKETILAAIDSLQAGGSTYGEGGIREAYRVARQHFIPNGINRILLCTDGDFNVGLRNADDLVRLVEEEARSGIFLTTLGVGTDNYKDALMRRLANRANGTYHYLDSFEETRRVLVDQMDATLVTVARDAKAQVEFNPGRVAAWRLIGYEKRLLPHEAFLDDSRDAGEVGAGHSVTVLYELVPAGLDIPAAVGPLKYQEPVTAPAPVPSRLVPSQELLTLKLRYQRPEGSPSRQQEHSVTDADRSFDQASIDFRFAAAVAAFANSLRQPSPGRDPHLDQILHWARGALGADPDGARAEFLTLVNKARQLVPQNH
ncbi:MAG: von Willebrand factor type A domain-containing protein [Verrucomicrobiae bacterium]|nr:von Willebrand factor type A domain-containing protein [Verrucomicrobiae bacterium]